MLTILPPGCKDPVYSDFCRHPGLTLSAVGISPYNPNDLYSDKILHWIKMKTIEVDDELYAYIASHTRHIGESASDILRRMLKFSAASQPGNSGFKRDSRVERCGGNKNRCAG